MEEEPSKATFFKDLKDLIVDYVQTRLELARISAYDKIAQVIAYLILGVLLSFLFFFGLLFLSVVAALYLSELFHNMLIGFGLVAAIYFLAFLFLARSKDNFLTRRIKDGIIRTLYKQHQQEENEFEED
jgi:uncharacterized membrane protein YqjE